ncbi:unnamed protein product [Strongylus vulgaris]|uniref:Uncharacterized protein n=1 Tax=Strongylus vulgaris TaxID=40348 RepID=A0A3P7LXP5_STRVU|nr:unnamed protein product [Strongylus vulgaris]
MASHQNLRHQTAPNHPVVFSAMAECVPSRSACKLNRGVLRHPDAPLRDIYAKQRFNIGFANLDRGVEDQPTSPILVEGQK